MSKCSAISTIVLIVLLTQAKSSAQVCATCAGDAAYKKITLFGAQGVCAYVPQAEVDIHTATNPSARWAYGQCANAPRSAGFVGLAATAGFLTGLSGTNDFLMVANDTCRHLRIANNSALENSGSICFDLTQTAGTQVNRMTLWRDGKIDFNVGNWNCQKGMIRFQGESWNGSSGNVDDPVVKLYRPTGTSTTCPDPTSYTWWIQNAGSSGGDNSGSLQFRALPTSGTIGSETVSTMQTRMIIQRDGNVGINTLTPVAKLNVTDGSVLFDGYTGSTPTSGGGSRLMWVPAKSAFRAGVAGSTSWDNANIGDYSWAGGVGTKSSGTASLSFGSETDVAADYSAAFGRYSTINSSANYSFAVGYFPTINATYSFCGGSNGITRSQYDFSYGRQCYTGIASSSFATSHCSFALGDECNAAGIDCLALGFQAILSGEYSYAIGREIDLSADYGVAIGAYLDNTGDGSFLIGSGVDGANRFPNTLANVIKFGTLTDAATMTITPKTGSTGACGLVGIGIDVPKNRLEVAGGLVVGENYVGTILKSDGDNRLFVEDRVCIGDNAVHAYTLYVAGTAFCTSSWSTSDSTCKREIKPYSKGLEAIRNIEPISFRYKSGFTSDTVDTHLGVVAQQLMKQIPTAVKLDTIRHSRVVVPGSMKVDTVANPSDSVHTRVKYTYTPDSVETTMETRYSVNSTDVLYTLVNGVKELDVLNDSNATNIQNMRQRMVSMDSSIALLTEQNKRLQLTVQELLARLSSEETGSYSSAAPVILEQNRPNPYSGTTEIVYWIDPSIDGDAVLEVTQYSSSRTVLTKPAAKAVATTEVIDATGWEKGIYIYCIRTDSRILACKKMIVIN